MLKYLWALPLIKWHHYVTELPNYAHLAVKMWSRNFPIFMANGVIKPPNSVR